MRSLLQSKFVYALTLVLVVQAVLFYSASRGEVVPHAAPLSGFPTRVGGWRLQQEGVIEKDEQDILKADDVLTRSTPVPKAARAFLSPISRRRGRGNRPTLPRIACRVRLAANGVGAHRRADRGRAAHPHQSICG